MTAKGTTLALDLIVAELGRIPSEDREEIAAGILGSLTGRFMLIENPTAAEDAQRARAELAGLIPGLFARGGSS